MNNLLSLQPEIKELQEKRLVGIRKEVSVATMNSVTHWVAFMQRRNEIKGHIENEYYSVQEYGKDYSFEGFNPTATFKKWAAVVVTTKTIIPDGMKTITLPSGKYAVFIGLKFS